MESYDIEMQSTKDRIESILLKGYIDEADVKFIRSIIPEIENDRIRNDLEEYLDKMNY